MAEVKRGVLWVPDSAELLLAAQRLRKKLSDDESKKERDIVDQTMHDISGLVQGATATTVLGDGVTDWKQVPEADRPKSKIRLSWTIPADIKFHLFAQFKRAIVEYAQKMSSTCYIYALQNKQTLTQFTIYFCVLEDTTTICTENQSASTTMCIETQSASTTMCIETQSHQPNQDLIVSPDKIDDYVQVQITPPPNPSDANKQTPL
jgi:hypothetical protein